MLSLTFSQYYIEINNGVNRRVQLYLFTFLQILNYYLISQMLERVGIKSGYGGKQPNNSNIMTVLQPIRATEYVTFSPNALITVNRWSFRGISFKGLLQQSGITFHHEKHVGLEVLEQ